MTEFAAAAPRGRSLAAREPQAPVSLTSPYVRHYELFSVSTPGTAARPATNYWRPSGGWTTDCAVRAAAAPIVDADVPLTRRARPSRRVRSQRVADIVLNTLDAACTSPLLIVAEDAHWFDDTTSEICARLADATTNSVVFAHPTSDSEGGLSRRTRRYGYRCAVTDDVVGSWSRRQRRSPPSVRTMRRCRDPCRGQSAVSRRTARIVRATDIDSLPDTSMR